MSDPLEGYMRISLTDIRADDALSFKKLNNGNIEVGIHIADVTHYVDEGGKIDKSEDSIFKLLRQNHRYWPDGVLEVDKVEAHVFIWFFPMYQ